MPIFIASDQALSQNTATIEPVNLDKIEIDRGKRHTNESLEQVDTFKRYEFNDDGVSAYTIPGMPGGMSLITGNEHDEFGLVSTDPVNRKRMMDKRHQKLTSVLKDLPQATRHGEQSARRGIIGIGMSYGVILEALELLEDQGISAQYFQPRVIFPQLDETVEFIESCDVIYVIDLNGGQQLRKLMVREGANDAKLRTIAHYDGTPIRPDIIVEHIADEVEQTKAEVA